MSDKKVNIDVGVKGVEETKSKLGSLGKFIKSRFVITLGDLSNIARKLFNVFKDVSKAAAESEQANKQLSFALKNQADASNQAIEDMQSFNSELQNNIGVSDEVIAQSQAIFVSLTGLSGQALKDATKAAADLSAVMGIDLTQAMEMIAKGSNGQMQSFQRLGLKIKEGSTQAENFQNIIIALNDKFSGNAQENMKTYSGAVARLGVAFDELKERIGGVLNKVLTPFVNALSIVINKTNGLWDKLANKNKTTNEQIQKTNEETHKKTMQQIEDEKNNRQKALEDAAKQEEEIQQAIQEAQKSSYFAQLGLTKEKNDLIEKNNLAQMQSAEDLGRFVLDSVKRRIIGEITLEEEAAIAKASIALATAIATLNFAGMAAAASQLAVPTAIAGAKIAAVNSVKFAQGGNFETSGTQSFNTSGGQTAIIGEAGKERVTVEPIGKSSGQNGSPIVLQINLDGKMLARQLHPHIQAIDRRVI